MEGVYFWVPQSSVPWGGRPFFYVEAEGIQDREPGFVTRMQIAEDQGQLLSCQPLCQDHLLTKPTRATP